MPTTIYSYTKKQNAFTEIVMALPDNQGPEDDTRATELCTISGITYVAIPDSMTLPEQPPELTIAPVTLTPALKAAIKAASVHVSFINERRQAKIRAVYSADDEAYFNRMALTALLSGTGLTPAQTATLTAYNGHVESCVQWAADERAKLGL
jgi:hypothetical protein